MGFDPLRIFLFPEGRAILAPKEYSNDHTDKTGHITNSGCCGRTDFKRRYTYSELTAQLRSMGADYTKIQEDIRDLIIMACMAVEPDVVSEMQKVTKHRDVCFHLLGLDVMLDSNLKPKLMEVNAEPALTANGLL